MGGEVKKEGVRGRKGGNGGLKRKEGGEGMRLKEKRTGTQRGGWVRGKGGGRERSLI